MLKKSLSIVLVALMIFSVISVGVISASAAYYESYIIREEQSPGGHDYEGGEKFYDVVSSDNNWSLEGDVRWKNYCIDCHPDSFSYYLESVNLSKCLSKLSSVTIPYAVSFVGHTFSSHDYYGYIDGTKTYSAKPGFDAHTFDGCKNLKYIYVNDKYLNDSNSIELNDSIGGGRGEWCYSSRDGILVKELYNTITVKIPVYDEFGRIDYYESEEHRLDHIGDILVRCPEGRTESSYTLPDNILEVSESAFNGCDNLKNIYVGQGNDFYTSVDGVLFDKNKETLIVLPYGKSKLLTEYVIPDGCKSIADSAFCSNETIKSITVPSSYESGSIYKLKEELPNLEKIIIIYNPDMSYRYIKSITNVVIPEGTTVINGSAFSGCNGISSVAIPKSVTKIHEGAFSNCTGIEDVYYAGTQDEWNEIKIFDNNKYLTYADIHFESDGEEQEIVKNGWAKEDGKWLYYKDGVAQTGWQKISKKWYYFNSDGIMQTGWQKISKKWYYFNSSGAMLTGWQKISKKWYYFNPSGAMLTGWQKISNKWYYFESSGAMKTGWLKSGGKWYYFNSSGVMLANCSQKIGNKTYKFNKSGVCLNP